MIGVAKTPGHTCLKKWKEGYEGLIPKYEGRPSKLTKNKKKIKNILKGKDSWTISTEVIREKFIVKNVIS